MDEGLEMRKKLVQQLMTGKNKAGALQASLQDPPVGGKPELKEENAKLVESVLQTISDAEMAGVLALIELEDCDVLMKYMYKFMQGNDSGQKTTNYPSLLKIHALLVQRAGVGSIVRVMADRKTV
jgi:actin related protein 2/3 complex, subunit 5